MPIIPHAANLEGPSPILGLSSGRSPHFPLSPLPSSTASPFPPQPTAPIARHPHRNHTHEVDSHSSLFGPSTICGSFPDTLSSASGAQFRILISTVVLFITRIRTTSSHLIAPPLLLRLTLHRQINIPPKNRAHALASLSVAATD